MNITIRDVDNNVFRGFKAEVVREGTTLGNALTRAMKLWLRHNSEKKKMKRSIVELKPFDWGEGTEKSSVEIDETLYGA